jgi:hypothetical protein
MGPLYGRAGRLTTENGGFWHGQWRRRRRTRRSGRASSSSHTKICKIRALLSYNFYEITPPVKRLATWTTFSAIITGFYHSDKVRSTSGRANRLRRNKAVNSTRCNNFLVRLAVRPLK